MRPYMPLGDPLLAGFDDEDEDPECCYDDYYYYGWS
jgi:hypothetical protein